MNHRQLTLQAKSKLEVGSLGDEDIDSMNAFDNLPREFSMVTVA